MGFCRRCGDIVSQARCHCGGSAVGTLHIELGQINLVIFSASTCYCVESRDEKDDRESR